MLNVSKRCNPRPKARDAPFTWATHSTARNALACVAFVPVEEVQERFSIPQTRLLLFVHLVETPRGLTLFLV
jgi:hypothetical protein